MPSTIHHMKPGLFGSSGPSLPYCPSLSAQKPPCPSRGVSFCLQLAALALDPASGRTLPSPLLLSSPPPRPIYSKICSTLPPPHPHPWTADLPLFSFPSPTFSSPVSHGHILGLDPLGRAGESGSHPPGEQPCCLPRSCPHESAPVEEQEVGFGLLDLGSKAQAQRGF